VHNTGDLGCGVPRVSVVVAVRGNPHALEGLLACLAGQEVAGCGVEVVIADNHTHATVEPPAVSAWPFTVRVVHEPVAGLSRARNAAIRAARGRVVAVTDPDARPRPGWLAGLLDALAVSGAWCAGGRVVAGFTGGHPPVLDARVWQMFAPPVGCWPDRVCVLRAPWWLVGCNLAFRRDPLPVFATGLGVCGRRRLSCEDLEITLRAQRAGRGVVVVPDAVVDRAVHPADVRLRALLHRAYGHGTSIARLRALHPDAEIYDSYRVIDAVRSARPVPVLLDLARIVGYRTARARCGGW